MYFSDPWRTAFLVHGALRARQNRVRCLRGTLAATAASMSIPSKGRLGGGAVPTAASIEREKSIVMQGWSDVVPGARMPGQTAIQGTLIPPSKRLPL